MTWADWLLVALGLYGLCGTAYDSWKFSGRHQRRITERQASHE